MKTSVLGMLAAALAFGASTIYLAVQLRAERALADELVEQTRVLTTRVAELEKSRSDRRFAGGNRFTVIPVAPGALAMGPPPQTASGGDATEHAEALVVDSPPRTEAFVKMMRSQARARNKRIYADVGAELRLSKEEANKLIDLLTDQQVEGFVPRQGASEEDIGRLIEEKQRENKTAIADLIGPAKAESLEQYQQSIPARQELEMISQQIEGSSSPVSDEQRRRLLAVLVEERARVPTPDYSDPKAYAEWQSGFNERVIEKARGILNPEQLTAYNEFQQWNKEMLEHAAMVREVSEPHGGEGNSVAILSTSSNGSVTFVQSARPVEKPRKAQ